MAKSNVASTEDIVDAYREGRAAFARAKAALVPASMANYERDIRQAMRDIGRSLEYAMRKHLLAHAQPPVAAGVRDGSAGLPA